MFSIERRLNVILIISRRGGASVPLRVRETTPGNRYFEHQRQPILSFLSVAAHVGRDIPRLAAYIALHTIP